MRQRTEDRERNAENRVQTTENRGRINIMVIGLPREITPYLMGLIGGIFYNDLEDF
jgi:hypothetical protein